MMEWQPIETAPKDGTEILIYSEIEGVRSSYFEHGMWQKGSWFSKPEERERAKPKKWMPLPKPPAV